MKLEATPLHYVAIEGVIGAGKTTLAKMLAPRLNAELVLEQFEDNPFLPLFYKEGGMHAFQTQLFFLLSRFKQQQEITQIDLFHSCMITDYVFERDRIFASVTLSESELKLYDQVSSVLQRNVPKPDLIVYLQSNVDRLYNNIVQRGRPMEQYITREYLELLNEQYNYFFFRQQDCPVLIVNSVDIDFVSNAEQFEELVSEITRPRTASIQYYQPMRRL
ncbi:MAG TPA: deoxynucleoside kinase [Candidatus Kapabacteria bacterium]|nr:deoxynucleoside kinase [Candidatus Kapabacteria bacterium]